MRRYSRDLSDPRDLTRDVRAALGLVGTKYPTSLSRTATLEDGRRVRLVASKPEALTRTTYRGRRVRSAEHRLQIKCPECQQWVPVGRYSQHAGKRSCQIEKSRYETRTPPRRGRLELRRLAYQASRSRAAREVLHDALLEAFPRQYPVVLRAAQRMAAERTSLNNGKTDVFIIFRSRHLKDYKQHDDSDFFYVSRMDPSISRYGEPGDVVSFVAERWLKR